MFDRLVHGERRPGRKARALVRLPDASALQRHERCALAPALVSPITGGDPWGEARSASSWSNRVPVDGFPTSGPRFGKRPDQRLARLCRWPPSRLHRVDRTDRGGRGRPSRRAVRCRRTREGERQRSPLAARRPQAVTLSTGRRARGHRPRGRPGDPFSNESRARAAALAGERREARRDAGRAGTV